MSRVTSQNQNGITPIAKKSSTLKKEAYHHGDLRDHLVSASRELIREHGADRFSISAACRAAGVSTAAPYRHFSDKEDLLIAVKVQGFASLRSCFEAAAAQHPRGTHESIAAIGESYVDFAREQPNVFRLMFNKKLEDHPNKPVLEDAGHTCFGVLLGEVAAFFGKAEPDEQVMRAAFPLWTFVHGAAFLVIDNLTEVTKIKFDIPTLIDDATVRLLGPKPF